MNNIKCKIRKNVLSLIALTLGAMSTGVLTSCGDFLEIEPQNEITLDKFWNEKSDVDAIIAGCYSKMQSYAIISRMMIWGEFRSENVVLYSDPAEKDQDLKKVLKENITANNAYTAWGDFYYVINNCNTLLKYAPDVAKVDPSYSNSQLKADIAEATAIRSLCYFYLIRTFRNVPYSEECFLDDSQILDIEAKSFDDVLARLISSLEEVKDYALEAYPENKSDYSKFYNTGRITKWAIYSMLCEMYLWQKDYAKCVEYAKLIINHKKEEVKANKSYSEADFANWGGYPLIGTRYRSQNNTYGQSFNEIFVTGNSIESIFELTFIKGSDDKQLSNGPYSNFYGGIGRAAWVNASSYVSLDEPNATYKVYDKQNKGLDMRAYENMIWAGKDTPARIGKNTVKNPIYFFAAPSASNFWSMMMLSDQYETHGKDAESRNKANFIFYRLSDIMLLAAEATAQMISQESGDLTSQSDIEKRNYAFSLVNAVNKRSIAQTELKDTLVMTNYNTKETITDLVYEERHRELMFEGKRYFDLVRRSQREGNTNYLAKKCANKDTDLQSIIESKMKKMDAIYWPYNLDELKVNSHLVQNPAFGSGENSSFEAN